jgi:hypothetical protein
MGSLVSILLNGTLVAGTVWFVILDGGNGDAVEDEPSNTLSLAELLVRVNNHNNNHNDNHHQEPPPQQPQEQQQQQQEQQLTNYWDWMCRRLQRHPEEAAAYCHSVEPSPLVQCLSVSSSSSSSPGIVIPVAVIRAFVQAYEDAVFHTDRHGVTPLMAAVRRASWSNNNSSHQHVRRSRTVPESTTITTSTFASTAATTERPDGPFERSTNHNHETSSTADSDTANASSSTTTTTTTFIDTTAADIVQLLLQVHPGAARQADRTGKIPLHHAGRSDGTTVQRLVQAYPQGVTQSDHTGRLPLHYYCCAQWMEQEQDATSQQQQQQQQQQVALPDPQIAQLLLGQSITATSPTTTTTTTTSLALISDKQGVTPLDLFYQTLKSHLLLQTRPGTTTTTTLSSSWDQDGDVLWEILTLLVQSTITTCGSLEPEPFLMIHNLVSLQCPAIVIREALRRFPQQAVQRDAQGRTPLLLAVALLKNALTTTTNNKTTTTTTTTTNLILDQVDDDERTAVICELLRGKAAAAARMTDVEGRLAIDLLSEQGVYNVQLFEAIVRAEPRAVDTRDLKNKQHPFLTAAMAGEKSNVASVYHLLRAQPHVIRYFLNEC